jgi:hypothetical protein
MAINSPSAIRLEVAAIFPDPIGAIPELLMLGMDDRALPSISRGPTEGTTVIGSSADRTTRSTRCRRNIAPHG